MANTILINGIQPLAQALIKKGVINQWFFIRYADPEPHIRLRFHIHYPDKNLGLIISKIKDVIYPFLDSGLLYKVQTDTYQRELERFGEERITDVESFFYFDSESIIQMINSANNEKNFLLQIMKSIDGLMQDFNFNLKQKLKFTQKNLEEFKKEFGANKYTNRQVLNKFSLVKEDMESKLNTDNFSFLSQKSKETRKNLIESLKKSFKTSNSKITIEDLVWILVHMHCNRAFISEQRKYELLCYYFLVQHYKDRIFKSK